MKIVDIGVLNQSFMEFAIPSDFAKNALYYCLEFGHFFCDGQYNIQRKYLESFLAVYVCSGALIVETDGKTAIARTDQLVLLDCRRQHRYYCQEYAEFLWFHFNGNSSSEYVTYLYESFGIVFTGDGIKELQQDFWKIFSEAQISTGNQHRISLHINRILCQLADHNTKTINDSIYPAIRYISENYDCHTDLDELAMLCRISKPHLIRCFKRYLNCTPHEYLLAYRLRQSKRMLIGTDMTIEEIAERCGFHSASHFARAFRGNNAITPTEFRKLQF